MVIPQTILFKIDELTNNKNWFVLWCTFGNSITRIYSERVTAFPIFSQLSVH